MLEGHQILSLDEKGGDKSIIKRILIVSFTILRSFV